MTTISEQQFMNGTVPRNCTMNELIRY